MAMREICSVEAAAMIGMHADFLAKSQETLELVQSDVQDAAEGSFQMESLALELDQLFTRGGVFSKHGKNSYTQIVLRTCRRPHFPILDREVLNVLRSAGP